MTEFDIDVSAISLELRYFACDFDDLRDVANLKGRIDASRSVGFDGDARHIVGLETGGLHVDFLDIGN